MKEAFIDWRPRGSSLELLSTVDQVVARYQRQGLTLTLRQLYYQLVAGGHIPNTLRSYKSVGTLVDSARLAGLLDWSAIEDRTRTPYRTDGIDTSPENAIRTTAAGYARALWADQPNHVEVWVEKEALSGIVQQAAAQVGITYFACRGYVSQSAMYEAGKRLAYRGRRGKDCHVLYLGDHDPSGIDMTRDITERLTMFAAPYAPTVHRLALNMDQVREYDPPPNPAKVTDSRFEAYELEFGDESWELDALEPNVLIDLITTKALDLRDEELWAAAQDRQETERYQLQRVADNWDYVLEVV